MKRVIAVGLGGMLGSLLRYGLGGMLNRWRLLGFPHETLVINILGCLAIGALAAVADSRGILGGASRGFLFIGLLGGFTTFSTFGHETLQLARGGQGAMALLSVALHILLGLGAVWAGDAAVRAWLGR